VKPWVQNENEIKPRQGRQKISFATSLPPHPGLEHFGDHTHGFTVGYYRSLLRSFKQGRLGHSQNSLCSLRSFAVNFFA